MKVPEPRPYGRQKPATVADKAVFLELVRREVGPQLDGRAGH